MLSLPPELWCRRYPKRALHAPHRTSARKRSSAPILPRGQPSHGIHQHQPTRPLPFRAVGPLRATLLPQRFRETYVHSKVIFRLLYLYICNCFSILVHTVQYILVHTDLLVHNNECSNMYYNLKL